MPSGLGSFPIVISLLFASREPKAEIIGTLTSEARRGGNEIQRARSIWGGKISKKKKTGQKKENRTEKKRKQDRNGVPKAEWISCSTARWPWTPDLQGTAALPPSPVLCEASPGFLAAGPAWLWRAH